jgi:2-oxoglutarate dehydrogenase E1 component
VNITTPANFYHVLRRQMKRDFLKPLIVMSPKSLLRHPAAVSRIDDFTTGSFQEIIDDTAAPQKAARLILCSGKVYYDLADYREKNKVTDTSIVRVEQLYPLHTDRLSELAAQHAGARIVWVQEEPQNMGAWNHLAPSLEEIFKRKAAYAGREPAASPAVGALALHRRELADFLKAAFSI